MNSIIQKFQKSINDVGSSAVQVIRLTQQIKSVAEHRKQHPKDLHCKMGLTRAISDRKSLLAYLSKHDHACYLDLIKALDLRR